MKFMLAVGMGAAVNQFAAAVVQPPDPQSSSTLLVALGLLMSGGGLATAFAAWRYRQQGRQERDSLIGEAANAAVAASKGMLEEYRIELEHAKQAIRDLQDKLQRSNERIAVLEADLRTATAARDRLLEELMRQTDRRAAMTKQIAAMQKRISDLEHLVDGPSHTT